MQIKQNLNAKNEQQENWQQNLFAAKRLKWANIGSIWTSPHKKKKIITHLSL